MYRLFVAIDLPEKVRGRVMQMEGKLPGARWVPQEQLHLTLRFIGDVDEATFRLIKTALAAIDGVPFTLALASVGHFPPTRQPRVLWVGLEGHPRLFELQERVERELQKAGVPPEERKFSPHITIARLKDTPGTAVSAFEERNGAFHREEFQVAEWHLYSSTLTRTGAIHTREATYKLSG